MTPSLIAVAVGVLTATLLLLASSLYLHRGLAHGAVRFVRPVGLLMHASVWLLAGISADQWVRVHRLHHAAADGPLDPHGPGNFGRCGGVKVALLTFPLYRRAASQASARRSGGRRSLRWTGPAITFAFAAVCLGVGHALLAAAVHTFLFLGLQGSINGFGHGPTTGGEFDAVNRPALALVTFGEGLHRNHHRFPASPRLSARRWEYDFGYRLLVGLSYIRLASITERGQRAMKSMIGDT